MGQKPQGLQVVSKPYWDAWLSLPAQGCQHRYSSQSRAPALPLGALPSPPLCQDGDEGTKIPKGQGGRYPSPKAELLVALPSGRTPETPQLSPHHPCSGPFSADKHSMGGMARTAPGRGQPGSCRGWTQCSPAPAIPKYPAGPGWSFLSPAPAQPCFIPSMGCFLLHHTRFGAATGFVLELWFPSMCLAHLEEVLHMLPGCFLPHGWVGVFAHHVIDGLHDVQHFLEEGEHGCRVNMRLYFHFVPDPPLFCDAPEGPVRYLGVFLPALCTVWGHVCACLCD